MKKILVVGGAGYIGSHVVKELLDNDFEVRIYDNLSTGQRVNLFEKAEFVEGDILDYDKLLSVMDGIDGVVHLAAKKAVFESMENPNLYSENNITGSLNVLRAMCAKAIKAIVFSSTAAVYGEPKYLPIDEKHPVMPMNYYGFTKLKIEEFMKCYDDLKGIKFVALRYFNAVGYDKDGAVKGREKDVQNLLPIVIEVLEGKRDSLKVFGSDYPTVDGTGVRDYVHVSDLARAHLLALNKLFDGMESKIFNLGTGRGTSVKEMILAVEKLSGKKVNAEYVARRDGDPAELYADSSLAEEILGWKPKFLSMEEIVKTVL